MELAGERFDLDEAKKIIAGYCFAEPDVIDWNQPPGNNYGVSSPLLKRRRWGYLSYDCQRGPGPPPDIVDVLAPVMLNVTQGYGVRLITDLLVVAPHVRDVVAAIDNRFRFWHLGPDEVVPRTKEPTGPSRALHQGWYLVESVKGADVAVTHKLLHHAWPDLFPLLDNVTIDKVGRIEAWAWLLEDLHREQESFEVLERWFEGLAQKQGGVRLNRLRLYDILLWCRATGDDKEATKLGSSFV